jgi:outer membrane protein W
MIIICCATSHADAGERAYLSLKGGGFLPNGNELSDFDAGYNVEFAAGFRPAPYAAIELGSGYYYAERTKIDNTITRKASVSGVPATVTVKGVASYNAIDIFAGAGAGYYFGLVNLDKYDSATQASEKRNSHSNALGYHVVGGFDYHLGKRWSLGAEIKWFATRQRFNLNPVTLDQVSPAGAKTTWEMGGTTMNLGVKFLY